MPILRKAFFPLALAGMCLWGALIYSNTFHAPFVFDDERMILTNPTVLSGNIHTIWKYSYNHKRFVTFATFALNYKYSGPDVTSYHVLNLMIHLANALLVVWLVFLLLKTARLRNTDFFTHRYLFSFLCGWLFLSHPIQTQAVTYITQRFESLAFLFYLTAVCSFIKGRSTENSFKALTFYALSVISAILGVFTKETIFSLPAALVLVELVFLRANAAFQKKSGWIIFGAVFVGLFTISLLFFDYSKILTQFGDVGVTSGQYFLTQFHALWLYIRLLFVPIHQNLDHAIPATNGWDPTTLICFVSLSAIFLAGIWLCRNKPLMGFGILWFFVTLSVSSSFIPLPDFVMEHRVYPATMGFAVAVCAWLFSVKNKRLSVSILVVMILALSFFTYQRNAVWASDMTLWQDTVAKSPSNARAYNNLGEAYRVRGDHRTAIEYYLKALKTGNISKHVASKIHANLGASYEILGDHDKAIAYSLKAIEIFPNTVEAYVNLSYMYTQKHDYENALKYALGAMSAHTKTDASLNNLGVAYKNLGQYEKAEKYFLRALKLNPRCEEAKVNLARTHVLMGKEA